MSSTMVAHLQFYRQKQVNCRTIQDGDISWDNHRKYQRN